MKKELDIEAILYMCLFKLKEEKTDKYYSPEIIFNHPKTPVRKP